MSKGKKSGNKKATKIEKVLLVTAIIQLVTALITLISKLNE